MNVAGKQAQRQYIKVTSEFDATGYMQPKSITRENGKIYEIEKITDFRPAKDFGLSYNCDCFIVMIQGKSLPLFFEKTNPNFRSLVGRWFILVHK